MTIVHFWPWEWNKLSSIPRACTYVRQTQSLLQWNYSAKTFRGQPCWERLAVPILETPSSKVTYGFLLVLRCKIPNLLSSLKKTHLHCWPPHQDPSQMPPSSNWTSVRSAGGWKGQHHDAAPWGHLTSDMLPLQKWSLPHSPTHSAATHNLY